MANVNKRIPSNTQPTWQADINGKRYEYQSGINADVPEEVAALIDDAEAGMAKEDPRASQRGIEKDVTQIVKDNFAGGVGYEEPVEVVMLPETSFEIVAGSPGVLISESFPYTLEVGQDYTVTLDGEAQTCTAFEAKTGGFLTNTSLDDAMSGNGWVCNVDNNALRFSSFDSSMLGTHTISISGSVNTVRKIDSKYVPIKALYANSAGNLFTDFDSFEQDNPPSVPLTYQEAYSLLNSCSSVFIFGGSGNARYTVAGIRGGTWDSNAREYKYIYFDVMDSDSATVKTFTVENPNYSGTS